MTRTNQETIAPYQAVVITSYGGPDGPDAVLPFMRNATFGRGIPDERLIEVAGHYHRWDGVSPIIEKTEQLRSDVAEELIRRGIDVPVVVGNRNWHPFLSATLANLADEGRTHVLSLPTSAFASYSGCRQYWEDIDRATAYVAGKKLEPRNGESLAERVHPIQMHVDKVRPYFNTSGFVEANVQAVIDAYDSLCAEGIASQDVALLFVTHSIPLGMEKGSAPRSDETDLGDAPSADSEVAYIQQHHDLATVLMDEIRLRMRERSVCDYSLVYCSRSGPAQAKWLEPDVNDAIEQIAAESPEIRAVIVAPIGFICDHMEVVFDLDTEAAETAHDHHLAYRRAATAADNPAFITSVVDRLLERAALARGEDVNLTSVTGRGPFHTVCPASACTTITHHRGNTHDLKPHVIAPMKENSHE
ncbi:ferrochelatase [Actinomyces vulturis]|uniref:ferrochelatase n=1 Tax=Actinomyces vulturis TaxID=1857645 RepID=UPI0008305FF5|nr:ferrochelatase [Actinomyces vulturis]